MQNEPYTVEQIEEGLWRIREGHVYMYLVEGEEAALLIDTGFGGGDLRGLVESLTEKPVEVLLTHAHGDHTGGADQFDWVYLHPADWAMLAQMPGGAELDLESIEAEDIIDLGGGLILEAIHIPGHTPGSVALYESEKGWLFSGDVLQEGPIYMFMPHCSLRAQLCSLEKLAGVDFSVAYPGHNRETVDKSYIPELVACGQRILAGELSGEPVEGMDCKLYRSGKVSVYYR